jgi:hypothetical protein
MKFFTFPDFARQWYFFAFGLFISCSQSHKNEKELGQTFFFQNKDFKVLPGENLEYEVEMGPFTVGDVSVEVLPFDTLPKNKGLVHIIAKASTRNGLSWISEISHVWNSWVDTSTGLSHYTHRKVKENKYNIEQEVHFYPDSQMLVQKDLHRPDRPPKKFEARPVRMKDLINTVWQIRYTPFEEKKSGDTLSYLSFFDGEWIVLNLKYMGLNQVGKKKDKKSYFILKPLGLRSRLFRGEMPVEIWIEEAAKRRPARVKVSSYVGNATILLKGS